MFQEIVVRRASDVFRCAAAGGSCYDTLPAGARLVCAVLRFHLTGAGQPYFAEIWPPHILTLTPAYAAEPMKCWLAAHDFALISSPLASPPPPHPPELSQPMQSL